MIRKCLIAALLAAVFGIISYGQFTDCSTGLLQMPTAEMQDDGTFMVTTNFLNKHATSSRWSYHTIQYGIYVSFWDRMEIGYVCTIFNDYWQGMQSRDGDVWEVNQDRHFVGRICLLKEGEFGINWIPALVIGVSDPVTGSGSGEYIGSKVDGSDRNGYFNRNYAMLTKHFQTPWGTIGAHAGFQFNVRIDKPINGPCAGVDWTPVWIQKMGILDNVKVILEYDCRTVNMGFIASIWDNRFEAMIEL